MLVSERTVSAEAHQATIETVRQITDSAGQTVLVTNRYVELATGLNRKSTETGQWLRASDAVEEFDQGFVARQSAHQVLWPRTLDEAAVIDVRDAEGHRYRSRVLGLSWFDAASGRSALIAETRSAQGRLVTTNTVLYEDAFDGIEADLAYVNRRGGLSQEVILREALPGPELWGLAPESARLEVITEFVEAPAFTKRERVLRPVAPEAERTTWAEPDLVDADVRFGAYRLGPGRAFALGEEDDLGAGTGVAKRWVELDGRRVLFEQVEWRQVKDEIGRLPRQARADGQDDAIPRTASVTRHLPARPVAVAVDFDREDHPLRTSEPLLAAHDIGPRNSSPGYVLDYELVTSQADLTFKGDTTYYVSGTVILTGTTTLEGAVVKFAPLLVPILVRDEFVDQTALYRPAVFTARDDNTVGAVIAESTGTVGTGYYGVFHLYFQTDGPVDVRHVRCKHAYYGLGFHGYYGNHTHLVRHVQLIDCLRPVMAMGGITLKMQNALIADVKANGAAFYGNNYATVEGQHLSVANSPNLYQYQTPANFTLYNSLLVDVTVQDFTRRGQSDNVETTGVSTVFQTVGGGSYYLAEDSPYLYVAPPLGELSDDLERCRVVPPVQLTGTLSEDVVLYPSVPRVDYSLGYHYPLVDYLLGGLTLQGCTLTLRNGVVVGSFGPEGLTLGNGAKFHSEGSPLALNRLTQYEAVQEDSEAGGSGTSSSFLDIPDGTTGVEVHLRFTAVSRLAHADWHRYLINHRGNDLALTIIDSQLYGVYLNLYNDHDGVTSVSLRNNLFQRCATILEQGGETVAFPAWLYNNLFAQGSVELYDVDNLGGWAVKDNLFDCDTLWASSTISASYNGFRSSLTPFGSNNQTGLSPDYAAGKYGDFYYQPGGSLWTHLVDAGSRMADEAGLYHFTVNPTSPPYYDDPDTPNEDERQLVKERDTPVDIGFHYPVYLDSETIPDGLLDWEEDRNGNGQQEVGETGWEGLYYDADGDGAYDGAEVAAGTNPLAADTDGDGWNDGQELSHHATNPLDIGNTPPAERLAYWRFNGQTASEEGIAPNSGTVTSFDPSFEEEAAGFTTAGSGLVYPCVDAQGRRAIDLHHGSLRFWYLPEWPQGKPGASCVLFESGTSDGSELCRLRVTPDGKWLVYDTTLYLPGLVLERLRLPLEPSPGAQPHSGETAWEISLEWSRRYCRLAIGGLYYDSSSQPGLAVPLSQSALERGWCLGGSFDGTMPALGGIDQVQTFSASLAPPVAGAAFPTRVARWWDVNDRAEQVITAAADSGGITLQWIPRHHGAVDDPDNYTVQRRQISLSPGAFETLAGNVRKDHYEDRIAQVGTAYEYRIPRGNPATAVDAVTTTAAREASPLHHRGTVLLLVDHTLDSALTGDVADYTQDLRADGWTVLKELAPRHDDAWSDWPNGPDYSYPSDIAAVKDTIEGAYAALQGAEPLYVVILGHVVIPYSGDACEDGHYGHDGAWPADAYYGDMDGVWQDSGTLKEAEDPEHPSANEKTLGNLPNDGKWDENKMPGDGELEVPIGRIDFAGLASTFSTDPPDPPVPWLAALHENKEVALIQHYLAKARAYRTKAAPYNNLDYETNPAHTWRYFQRTMTFDWLLNSARSIETRLNGTSAEEYWQPNESKPDALNRDVFLPQNQYDATYLWGIHGGYGASYRIAWSEGDRTSQHLADTEGTYAPPVVFYVLAGSWFGDWMWGVGWQHQFMRACLGTEHFGLGSMWSLRGSGNNPPSGPWRMDRCGLGFPLGAALQDTFRLNEKQSVRTVYILGDPTLRCYVTAPVTNLHGVVEDCFPGPKTVHLTWSASTGADAYYVYRGADFEDALATEPRSGPIVPTQWTDTCPVSSGTYVYAVRAVRLITSGAGSFQDLSAAASETINVP